MEIKNQTQDPPPSPVVKHCAKTTDTSQISLSCRATAGGEPSMLHAKDAGKTTALFNSYISWLKKQIQLSAAKNTKHIGW